MQTVTLLKKQTGPETLVSHKQDWFQALFPLLSYLTSSKMRFSLEIQRFSVTSILLFPGSKAAFQAVDVVDSTGESTVKLPRGITVEGAFQESHKHDITMCGPGYPSHIWIPSRTGEAGGRQQWGEGKGEAPRASEWGQPHSLLRVLLPPTPSLKRAVLFFSTFRKLSRSPRIRKSSSDALNSLTSLLPSRVTDFSGLNQNVLVSRGCSPLFSYTELPKSVFCAYFSLWVYRQHSVRGQRWNQIKHPCRTFSAQKVPPPHPAWVAPSATESDSWGASKGLQGPHQPSPQQLFWCWWWSFLPLLDLLETVEQLRKGGPMALLGEPSLNGWMPLFFLFN